MQVEGEFLSFFSKLLGTAAEEMLCLNTEVIQKGPCLTLPQKRLLIEKVTEPEILNAMKSMPKEKSPGIDGYLIEFYTQNWIMLDMMSSWLFRNSLLLGSF